MCRGNNYVKDELIYLIISSFLHLKDNVLTRKEAEVVKLRQTRLFCTIR